MCDSVFKEAELLAKDLSKVTKNVYEVKKYIDELGRQTYYLLFKDNILISKGALSLLCIVNTLKNIVTVDTTRQLAKEYSELSGESYSLVTEREYENLQYSIFSGQHLLCKDGKRVKVEKLTLPYLRKHNLNGIYHHLIKLKNSFLKKKETTNNTKPVITMHTAFYVNTIPLKDLSDIQLKELKDKLNKEIDLREQQSLDSTNRVFIPSKCPTLQIRLPTKYKDLELNQLEIHVSSILNTKVSVSSTDISENTLLVLYTLKDNNRDYNYS